MAIQTRFYVEKGPSDGQLQKFVDPSVSGVERFRTPIIIVQYDDTDPNVVQTLDNYMDSLGFDNLTGNLAFDVFSRPGNPGAVAGRCRFYALTIGGVTHAFIRDDDGGTYQITPSQKPTGYVNGLVTSFATASQVQIAAGTCRDRTDKNDLTLAAPVTVDITIAGAGGLDTGVEAANTWYYIHLIGDSNAVNPTVGILSTNQNAPTLPAGYDRSRRVGSVRNDGASNFVSFVVRGNATDRSVQYRDAVTNHQALTGGAATVITAVNCTAHIPNTGGFGRFEFVQRGTVIATFFDDQAATVPQRTLPAANTMGDVVMRVSGSQRLAYQNAAAGGLVDVYVTGYEESL
ncbi:MAG TPA: hypothetical protein VLE97_07095 [Gaiellaceae bacterium]|nr:hypothetical protein [Gaiellaceae bacterium]